MNKAKTILLCGVGGQGALLAADLIARMAIAAGDDVKLSEIHGMSQRGGSVTTVVKIGKEVHSMVADFGNVDFLLSFETTEALRNVSYLKHDGCMLVNDVAIKPLPVLSGKASMPDSPQESLMKIGAHLVPAEVLALEAGSTKAVNVVLLGCLSAFLDYDICLWNSVIENRVPSRFVAINLKAFHLGRQWALNQMKD